MPTNGQFAVGELVTASDANTLFTRGYQNRIINGAFVINQRGYTSTTNLASGSYGFDRWKSGFTNTALTFTAGSQSTTVTISSSGVLQQIIERENMPAGTYILSWTGTATGRIYNSGATPPAYAAGPITVTLDGSANVVVEFTASGSTKTLGLVQLEAGTVYSPFEYRHRADELALCQRYFIRFTGTNIFTIYGFTMAYSSVNASGLIHVPVTMRSNSITVTFQNLVLATAALIAAVTNVTAPANNGTTCIGLDWTVGSGLTSSTMYRVLSNNTATSHLSLEAEL